MQEIRFKGFSCDGN